MFKDGTITKITLPGENVTLTSEAEARAYFASKNQNKKFKMGSMTIELADGTQLTKNEGSPIFPPGMSDVAIEAEIKRIGDTPAVGAVKKGSFTGESYHVGEITFNGETTCVGIIKDADGNIITAIPIESNEWLSGIVDIDTTTPHKRRSYDKK